MKYIPVSDSVIGIEEEQRVIECLRSGWISKGKYIEMFEKEFAEYVGTKYAISCNTGTSALHLALLSSGIEKRDEVILPTMTFVATAFVVSYCNAKPVFVDSEPNYWCIDPDKIIEEITPKTKAIIAVDLFGHPANYDALSEIAEDFDLILISDSAESLGSEYIGKKNKGKTGTFGDASCFSFFGNKIITCGEGGMLVTDNKEISDKAIGYRNNCTIYPYYHDNIGYNYRLDNVRSSMCYAQLKNIDKFLDIKRSNAKKYISMLKKLKKLKNNINVQKEESWAKSNYWMFCLTIDPKLKIKMDVEHIRKKLTEYGIDTRPFFTPMHMLPMYRDCVDKDCVDKYSVSEMLFKTGLSLPSGCSLTEEDIEYIVNAIDKILEIEDEGDK